MRTKTLMCVALSWVSGVAALPACADGFGTGSGSWIGNLLNGNQATGVDSAVVAGANNFAGAQGAFIGAGTANQATGLSSMVLGGFDNRATFVDALVGAGAGNRASGARSVIVGGGYNLASGHVSFIGGGGRSTVETTPAGTHAHDNVATRRWTVVVGGLGNEASADGAAVVGGGFNVASGVGSFVGGGGICCENDVATALPNVASGAVSAITGGEGNTASGRGTAIGGGRGNTAANLYSTVGGGFGNSVTDGWGTVAGGQNNRAGANGAVAGGADNHADGGQATVGGGSGNSATQVWATVSGGLNNTASGGGATVAGGFNNTASGTNSFAAGANANANANDCVAFSLWGGSAPGMPCFGGSGGFNVGAPGGYAFDFGAKRADGGGTAWIAFGRFGGQHISTSTGAFLTTAGVWVNAASTAASKTDFVPVDTTAVLDKVATLPITTWRYKEGEGDVRHMGPMAEDFWSAFGIGYGAHTIADLDARGVALAAIQGLNGKLETALAERDLIVAAQAREIAAQAKELAELKRAVEVLLARASAEDRVAATTH